MVSSKPIEDFLTFLRDVQTEYHMAVATESETTSVTNDLLHQLELLEHTYHEYAQVAKRLTEVRQERRKAKDIMFAAEPILAWVENNKSCIKGMEQLLGEVRKAERATENRIYTPRAGAKK